MRSQRSAPRPKESAIAPKTQTTEALLNDIHASLAKLVEAARQEGRDATQAAVRPLVGSATATEPTNTKSSKKRRNSWKGLTDEQRLVRVNAIRKGLEPKTELQGRLRVLLRAVGAEGADATRAAERPQTGEPATD